MTHFAKRNSDSTPRNAIRRRSISFQPLMQGTTPNRRMYGVPSSQHYQSGPYGYSNPPLLPQPSASTSTTTSNSLHALSQAALGHSNALPQQHDRSQQALRTAPRVAESNVSEGGRSLSPTSATGVREDDDSKDGKSSTTKAKGTRKRGRKRIEEDAAAIEGKLHNWFLLVRESTH